MMAGLTDKEIANRKGRITGSTFAGLLGYSPYDSPSYWWALQMGAPGVKPTLPMRLGIRYEDVITESAVEALTEGRVRLGKAGDVYRRGEKPTSVFHAQEREWLVVHPDWVCWDAKELIQSKRHDPRLAAQYGNLPEERHNDQVPLHELIQCQVELACWRSQYGQSWRTCWLAVEFGYGSGPVLYRIAYDPQLADSLIEAGRRFWNVHMDPMDPHRPDDEEWKRWIAGGQAEDRKKKFTPARVKLAPSDLLAAPIPQVGAR